MAIATGRCSAIESALLCRDDHGKLRRIVCNVGTTGSPTGHNLVHRAVQGLFKEAGLSPNFFWDGSFDVPEAYLPADHRRVLDEARTTHAANTITDTVRAGACLPLLPTAATAQFVNARHRQHWRALHHTRGRSHTCWCSPCMQHCSQALTACRQSWRAGRAQQHRD